MRPRPILLLLLQVVLRWSPDPNAATSAQEVAAAASTLQTEGKWTDAQRTLETGVADCGTGGPGRTCRVFLNHTLAFLAERQGSAPTALEYYQRVLADAPNSGPARNNMGLLYQRQGDLSKAESAFRTAIETDPTGSSGYRVRLGDLYYAQNKWSDAWAAYAKAAEEAPEPDLARRRLIECWRKWKGGGDLLTLARTWEESSPTVAIMAYQAVAESSAKDELSTLLRIADVLARQEALSPRDLDENLLSPRPPEAEELRAFVSDPGQVPKESSWWLSAELQKHVLARTALASGRRELLQGQTKSAASYWQVGVKLSPRYERYAMKDVDALGIPRLDLESALATLYFQHPDLDPGGEKQSALIEDLFGGKMIAIRAADQAAILRYHMVLGLIYADRGVWTKGGYRSAFFQLEAAVQTADRLRQYFGVQQPLGELKSLLAEAYASNPESSRRWSMEAAKAYLDSDDLDRAEEALHRANDSHPTEAQRKQLRVLGEILATRRDPVKKDRWMDSTDLPLPPDFLGRQRFKVRSDRAAGLGREEAAEQAALALTEAIDGKVALIGTADLLRLKNVRAIVARRLDVPVQATRVQRFASEHDDPSEIDRLRRSGLPLAVASDSAPRRVPIDGNELFSARVACAVGAAREPVRFAVREGRITVYGDGPETREVEARLRGVKGMKSVEVRRSQDQ